MECKDCRTECIGATPCKKCAEKIDNKAILKKITIIFGTLVILYWIGVVV